ncbi:MAG: rRNA maturation RNase YbeY [Eubacterium sp.]|nr:rRNA maturation RNase YbeY [Eubacterium sp.]
MKVKLLLRNEIRDKNILNTIQIKKKLKKWVIYTLTVENFVENVEISVLLIDNKKIKDYNKNFRGIDKITDVLSFPMGGHNIETGYFMLGDVVISVEKAVEQAKEYGHSIEREMAFLMIHSTLHLLGYDHLKDKDEKIMRKKQTEILNGLGLEVKI